MSGIHMALMSAGRGPAVGSMTAGASAGTVGYWLTSGAGSISPSGLRYGGFLISGIYDSTGTNFYLQIDGALTADFCQSIVVNGTTWQTSAAAFFTGDVGGEIVSQWSWAASTAGFSNGSSYPFTIY